MQHWIATPQARLAMTMPLSAVGTFGGWYKAPVKALLFAAACLPPLGYRVAAAILFLRLQPRMHRKAKIAAEQDFC